MSDAPVASEPREHLGREVVERPHHHPGLGEHRVRAAFREPEVRQARRTRLVDHHVRRLDVAVHDAARVQRVQPRRDVGHHADHVRERERTVARETSLEGLAADERHREVRAALGLAGVRDRHQVLVPDLAGRARLVDEPLPERLVGRELGAQHLERDLVALGFADGAEDDAHPALAQPFLESIGAESRARFQIRHARRIVRCRKCPVLGAARCYNLLRWPRTHV